MDLAIKLIVLLPLLAAAIAGLFCRVIGDRPAQIVTCAALLIAAALSIFVFVRIGFGPENGKLVVVKLFNWIASGAFDVTLEPAEPSDPVVDKNPGFEVGGPLESVGCGVVFAKFHLGIPEGEPVLPVGRRRGDERLGGRGGLGEAMFLREHTST